MSEAPRWESGGIESPAERTDPFLPVISDDMISPPKVPALDDRRLAGLLAELDAEDLLPPDDAMDPVSAPPATDTEPEPQAPSALPVPRRPVSPGLASAEVVRPAPLPALVPAQARSRPSGEDARHEDARHEDARHEDARHEDARHEDARHEDAARADARREDARRKYESARREYVRREYQPPPAAVDTMSLTGLTRRTSGRLGSMLFTGFFLAIFLLILIEVVVSLLRVSS